MNNTELKEKIEQMEKELNKLKKAVKENDEPKFERVEEYFFVGFNRRYDFGAITHTDDYSVSDNYHYNNNNYFYTRKRAEEVCDKIKVLLKLERLHDIYCPDYVPDWNNTKETKYYIYYNNGDKFWSTVGCCLTQNSFGVYFPTEEIAQKVCDILNAEKEN